MKNNYSIRWSILLVILLWLGLSACEPDGQEALATPADLASPLNVYDDSKFIQQTIPLPTPVLKGAISLEEALTKRRSVRAFSDVPLSLVELGQLLWAAQGITHPAGYRTAPSAGALYPLEMYVNTVEGLYRYDPPTHSLILHREGDLTQALYAAALKQEAILDAPAVFIISAVYERTAQKYGWDRSPRYVHLEAGHAAQNLLLQAAALDLGAVPIGAFFDDEVKDALSLPEDHQPLYLIPIGHPEID